ncbi:MAG: CRISPR-associated endonuclease Cas2 [Thermoplasmata archaeon]|jgi:CRISPR-associated protein Cas2
MYAIIVYDVDVKRVSKINKFLKSYLVWRQNSVFEGEITESQLERIKIKLKNIIDESIDSVLIYVLPSKNNLIVEILGTDKGPTLNIL